MYTEDVPELSRRAFEQLLANGERVVFTRRQHPIVLWRVTLIALAFACFILFALVAGSLPADSYAVGFLFLLASFLWWGYQYLQWRKQWFGVTTKRILFLAGLIDKDIQMMPLSKLTDMTFKKTWTGDILGYGHFIVESAGQKQALERLRFIPDAGRARELMTGLLFGYFPAPVRITDPDPLPVVLRGSYADGLPDGFGPDGPEGGPGGPGGAGGPGGGAGNSGGAGGSGGPGSSPGGATSPHDDYDDDEEDLTGFDDEDDGQPDVRPAGAAPAPGHPYRPSPTSDPTSDPDIPESGGAEHAWQVSHEDGITIYSSREPAWSTRTADTGPIPIVFHPRPRRR